MWGEGVILHTSMCMRGTHADITYGALDVLRTAAAIATTTIATAAATVAACVMGAGMVCGVVCCAQCKTSCWQRGKARQNEAIAPPPP